MHFRNRRLAALLSVLCLTVSSAAKDLAPYGFERFFDSSRLVRIELDLSPADWDRIRAQHRSLVKTLRTDIPPSDQKKPFDYVTAQLTIDGTKVTYVTAEGTFMKGPPFGGNKVPVPDSGLLGAIIGGKQGAVFIKATGPKAIVKSADKALKAMVTKALKE